MPSPLRLAPPPRSRAALGLAAGMLAAALTWLTACNPLTFAFSQPSTPATVEYKDAQGRFSIRYPADWSSGPGEGRQVVLFEGKLQLPEEVALGVIVATIDASASAGATGSAILDQYARSYADEIQKQNETVFATGSATLDGLPARTIDHSIKVQGKSFKSRQLVAIKDATAYQLSFLVSPPEKFEEWLPAQRAMAETFKILK